jgi:hypothetical protein
MPLFAGATVGLDDASPDSAESWANCCLAAVAESLGLALGVDQVVVGVDHADFGVLVEDGAGFGDRSGCEEVVAVDAGDIVGLGVVDGSAEGRGCTLMGGKDELDAGILVGVLLGDLGGVVGGAVVPEDQGEVWVGLGEDRFDRAMNKEFAIIDSYNNNGRRDH